MPKPLPAGLEVRQALFRDIPSIADLLVSAPDDGSLYQFPHIQEYDDEMRAMHISWLKSSIHDTKSLTRVAVVPGESGSPDVVVGFSSWSKKETGQSSDGSSQPVDIAEPPSEDELAAVRQDKEKQPAEEPKPKGPSKALERNKPRSAGLRRVRDRTASPSDKLNSYTLEGLAILDKFQGHGIGSLLVQWGLDKAAEQGVPVFATGEARGVNFYVNALGFRKLPDSEYWLDSQGGDISRGDVESGNDAWTAAKGGLSGAEVVWTPEGYKLGIN